MVLRNGSSFLVFVGLLIPGIGLAGPSNYDECIIDSMKGVSSDIAAQAIISSCRNLFPGEKEVATRVVDAAAQPQESAPAPAPVPQPAPVATGPSRSLTTAELDKLGARIRALGSSYTAVIENKNESLTVTEVTIAVFDESDPRSLREYPQEVRIAPSESAETKFTVHYRGDEFSWAWKVASAKGFD